MALKARYWNFKTITRTKTLPFPTNLGPRIYAAARELLARVPPGPLRLLGVQVSNLDDVRTPLQGELWAPEAVPEDEGGQEPPGPAPETARLLRATESSDLLRKKYGRAAVLPASLLGRERATGRDGSDGAPGRG